MKRPHTPRPEIVAAVDAVIATAWTPPPNADDAALVKAKHEWQRLLAECERLSETVDDEQADRIYDHANTLFDYVLAAPVTSFRSAAVVVNTALQQMESGRRYDGLEFDALERVQAWLLAQATAAHPPVA